MKIKICGITSLEDALVAVEAGAHMLGYNFYQDSPRRLTPETCEAIQSGLARSNAQVVGVGIFVNHAVEEIQAVMDACGLGLAQCSGDESAADLAQLGDRAFKGIRARSPYQIHEMVTRIPARARPPAFLLDAYQPGSYGGTGKTVDWQLASELASRFPILLAGGLKPKNVASAVRQVRPWGVDVASGVENSPGVKDKDKMRAFVRLAVQAAGSQQEESIKPIQT